MNALATSTRALQWSPGVATPLPPVKRNTADSGGSIADRACPQNSKTAKKCVTPNRPSVTYVLDQIDLLPFTGQPQLEEIRLLRCFCYFPQHAG